MKLHPLNSIVFANPPRFIVPALGLCNERVNILCGDSHAGKTQVAIDLSVAACTGTHWLGLETHAGKVALLDYEMSTERCAAEANRMLRGRGLTSAGLDICGFDDGPAVIGASGWEQEFEKLADAYDLVVLDSLTGLLPGEEQNGAERMGPPLMALGRIGKQHGCCFVITHHNGKVRRTGAASGRGSTAIYASADTWLSLAVSNRQRKVLVEKAYLPQALHREITFEFVDIGEEDPTTRKSHALQLRATHARKLDVQLPISNQVLDALTDGPKFRTEVYSAVRARQDDVRRCIDGLIQNGLVRIENKKLVLAAMNVVA